ncbi:dTDP-4-dehydrorhamnose reductase [Lusitaniella coriacea]|uniref:dTDP-4-dehydrorhamnose reductase n=1 Tax=Lusitaniella coriacea TaxID=1983105 RepID=UPI003CFB1652
MRILLTGVTGQLGRELQRILPEIAEVIGCSRQEMDLAQPEQILRAIACVQPHLILNAGAYTAVDKAETELDLVRAINGIAPKFLAEEAQKREIALFHISTDYVFDGRKNTPYTEEDETNPLNAYGASKWVGEEGIRQATANHLILRTAWVYGAGETGNFVKTMLRLGAEREEIRVVSDQIGSPTWTGDLARAIAQLLTHTPFPTGTYHYTNSGVASWYDFAVAIFEEASNLDFPLKVKNVIPIATADYPTPARRPAYSVLSTQKIAALLSTQPPHWREGLRQMLRSM